MKNEQKQEDVISMIPARPTLQMALGRIRDVLFDLMSVSACDHVFYDYGSFGFWSGLLSRGTVFLPRLYKGQAEGEECPLVRDLISLGFTGQEGRFRFVDDM